MNSKVIVSNARVPNVGDLHDLGLRNFVKGFEVGRTNIKVVAMVQSESTWTDTDRNQHKSITTTLLYEEEPKTDKL